MARTKVNRFTFDRHSVLLFSALTLAGASAATASTPASRNAANNASSPSAATSAYAPASSSGSRVSTSPVLLAQNKKAQL